MNVAFGAGGSDVPKFCDSKILFGVICIDCRAIARNDDILFVKDFGIDSCRVGSEFGVSDVYIDGTLGEIETEIGEVVAAVVERGVGIGFGRGVGEGDVDLVGDSVRTPFPRF